MEIFEKDLIYWEVIVSKSQEFKLGVSHRYMKPNKMGLMQHSIADEWNSWCIQRDSSGKLSVVSRSQVTPVFIPTHHTRNGRLYRLGVLCDANLGKISFINATVRPRRIVFTFSISFLKPLFPFFGLKQGSIQVVTKIPPPAITAGQ